MFIIKENLLKKNKGRYGDNVASNRNIIKRVFKRNQMGIPALKRKIAEIANSLEKLINKQKNH